MAVEEELRKDHSEMQAVIDTKQKIIEAQVSMLQRSDKCFYCKYFNARTSFWFTFQIFIAQPQNMALYKVYLYYQIWKLRNPKGIENIYSWDPMIKE